MPTKDTKYLRVRFPVETILQAFEVFKQVALEAWGEYRDGSRDSESWTPPTEPARMTYLSITAGPTKWTFDNHDEFYAELRKPYSSATCSFELNEVPGSNIRVHFYVYESFTEVVIDHPKRALVERLSAVLDSAAPGLTAPEPAAPAPPRPNVFIGHGGGSSQWRDLKDHLQDMHAYDVTAYETGARAGHTIRDVLGEMLEESTFAILVMSAEDIQQDHSVRARQNVVHEAGLFQGRLGFSRAIILLEEGTDAFSNIDGVQYIPFARNNIRESFGDVLATLRREFPS
jgi:predicted nucleotide-binding protein